ncbi:MAG: short-chain dehydrogenase, partial [Parafilimonas terrae]|nr:short-chain dehydrogenase [Parafilimonas terrae]
WIDGYLARHGYRGEMTSVQAQKNRPDNLYDPVDTDPGAHGRFDARATGQVVAADPRWLKLGLAAALGVVAGTMLFATEAQGRIEERRRDRRAHSGTIGLGRTTR